MKLVGSYDFAEYDPVLPTETTNIFAIDVIVQRSAEIEEWTYYVDIGLIWALLVLLTSTIYLFADKVRRMRNNRRKYQPFQIPQPIDGSRLQ